jgi:hypothetical protein
MKIEIPEITYEAVRYGRAGGGMLVPVDFQYNNPRRTLLWKPRTHAAIGIGNRVKCQVINSKTKRVVRETGWNNNLILANWLNLMGTSNAIETMFRYCHAGDGTIPWVEDSGATTGTTSGTTLTISGGTFTFGAGDVGKWVRFDTGEESEIASYTGPTEVELSASLGVAGATQFTMFDPARDQLSNQVTKTNTYLAGNPDTGTEISGYDVVMTRTYDHPSPGSNTPYSEIGFSVTGVDTALTAALVLSTGVVVTTLEQLRVIYEVTVTFGGYMTATNIDVPITGWPTGAIADKRGDVACVLPLITAVSSVSGLGSAMSTETSAPCSTFAFEPYYTNTSGGPNIFIGSSQAAHNAWGLAQPDRSTGANQYTTLNTAYVPGSYTLNKYKVFAPSDEVRADIGCIGFGGRNATSGYDSYEANNQGFVIAFDNLQEKEAAYALDIQFSITWGRKWA